MPSFTNSYTEPGTYVVINDDVLTQTNTGLLSVCIIGTGKKTKSINNLGLELVPPVNSASSDIPTILASGNFTAIPNWAVGTEFVENDYAVNSDKLYQCIVATATTSEFVDSEWSEVPEESILFLQNDKKDVTIISNQIVNYDESYYLCNTNTEIKYTYPAWEKNTMYYDNDYISYGNSFFNCIETHTSPDVNEPSGDYFKKYWKEVYPEYDNNYSAVIPNSDIYPVLNMYMPTRVVGGITTKVYDNYINPDGTESDEKVYFDIVDDGTKFIWINSDLPLTDKNAQGRIILNISYTAEKVASVDGKIKSFTRLSNIFNTYGAPSAENTISAAAQIAYDNGATVFYCVQPLDEGDVDDNNVLTVSGLQDGLRQAQTVDAYCIVPMLENTDDTNIASLCKTHVEKMSSTLERKERVCVISGAYREETSMDDITESIDYYKSTASAINSPRMVYIAPSSVVVNLDGENVPSSGMYAAAALAGIICNNNFTCGEPITGKTLADVSVNDKYTREEKNQLASYGCLVLEGAEGTTIPKIRHALSTATGDYVKSEIKITKIKDVISNTLRLALDRAYINTRFLGASTISEMTTTVNTILSSFLANNDIYSYNNLVIAQDQNYPNQVNVSFRIAPAVDLNYILITFGVTFQE